MYRWILLLACPLLLAADDDQRLELVFKAQVVFDHVSLAATPDLRDTLACVQTQAAVVPVALPGELPAVHYHKGFCELSGATITHNPQEFLAAAADFDKTIETWDEQPRRDKNKPLDPLPSAVYVLAIIAPLNAGWDDETLDRLEPQLRAFTEKPLCAPGLMAASFCEEVMRRGREWLGWMALRHEKLDRAANDFAGLSGTGWPEWVAGRKAFLAHRYQEAASLYQQAMEHQKMPPTSLLARLTPRADIPVELTDLGGAQLLAGNRAAAIASLDAAVKTDPANARALYLRARTRELDRQMDAALSDYNLASRAAFAKATDLASGEAHLYRGILFYRRHDYSHAEEEFSSALNFEIGPALRADAAAWRHLAAVTGGSCAASRQYLERSLASVSPYFPADEARKALTACPSTG